MAAGGRFTPLVCIVDFHHARGPEVERWFGVEADHDPVAHNDWSLLPFLALPDGSHSSDEELSYFTLRKADNEKQPVASLFGIACTRHIAATDLIYKHPDVTRSSVQKAVVAIIDNPYMFARIREKLSAVTKTWFAQRDFRDTSLIQEFHDSLIEHNAEHIEERDSYVGISLRQLVHQYKHQTLILFKCALLQPKMLFFGSNCERLCLLQFGLISLIPQLIRNLQDCADPRLNTYEKNTVPPASLKTSERASLLKYMGIPLQLFGQGSLFGPYTPLQQLDMLSDTGTKSFIAGSTNTLVLTQKERYSDVFINLNDDTIQIHSPILKNALYLTAADRRWIDFMTQTVNDTWDPDHPTRPTTHGYSGSEEMIRLQFEEYLLAFLSAVKYRQHSLKHGSVNDPNDPATDFSDAFLDSFLASDTARIWSKLTEPHLFDIVAPKHPCAGGLGLDDIQRRLAHLLLHFASRYTASKESDWPWGGCGVGQARVLIIVFLKLRRKTKTLKSKSQVAELQLDARFASTKDSVQKGFAASHAKMSSAFASVWDSLEDRRRKSPSPGPRSDVKDGEKGHARNVSLPPTPSAMLECEEKDERAPAANRASAYFSGWGSWAAEKRKAFSSTANSSSSSLAAAATPAAPLSTDIPPADKAGHSPHPLHHQTKPSDDMSVASSSAPADDQNGNGGYAALGSRGDDDGDDDEQSFRLSRAGVGKAEKVFDAEEPASRPGTAATNGSASASMGVNTSPRKV